MSGPFLLVSCRRTRRLPYWSWAVLSQSRLPRGIEVLGNYTVGPWSLAMLAKSCEVLPGLLGLGPVALQI